MKREREREREKEKEKERETKKVEMFVDRRGAFVILHRFIVNHFE
jgi:hypothetical protein